MARNVFRFRKLKWGDPEKPWLKRGSPLPQAGAEEPKRGALFDSPWMILAGSVLAFGLGWLLLSGA